VATLVEFLEVVAVDPILVDDFVTDPDGVLDRYGIASSLRPLLKSRDDVAILTAVLDGLTADREARPPPRAERQA
jgi:hypothetical protein